MITRTSVEQVRAIGDEMAKLRSDYQYESNAESIASEMKRLADLAENTAEYHSQIFQKCNVIRSFASSLTRPRKHKEALLEIQDPINAIRNWVPPGFDQEELVPA